MLVAGSTELVLVSLPFIKAFTGDTGDTVLIGVPLALLVLFWFLDPYAKNVHHLPDRYGVAKSATIHVPRRHCERSDELNQEATA